MEFTTNKSNLGSEYSYRHEIQNPTNNSRRVLFPWSQTSAICPITVLSLNLLTTTGDRTTDRLHILDMSPGWTSPEENMSRKKRRQGSFSTSSSSRSSDSRKRSRKSKRSKQSHRKRRKRSISSSSPSSDNHSNNYCRYKRSRHSPQAVESPITLQPAEITNVPTIPQPEYVFQRSTKDSGSDSEQETWSFDRAINDIFRLLSPEMSKADRGTYPAKPLSGIKHLMESHATPLLVLPQSKLV